MRHVMAALSSLTSSAGLSRWISTRRSILGSRRTELRFTVRRPASAEVSPCCHRPSGGDVACSIHVSIARPHPAGDALENRLALAVFRRHMPAVRASLRRKRCRNELKSPRGFVLQPGHQLSPPLAADLAVETAFLRDPGARAFSGPARRAHHRAHLQVLDPDSVEAARQIGGGLFHPVTAAICLTGSQLGSGQLRSCLPGRSALRPRQTLLQSVESFVFAGPKGRGAQQLTAGQRNGDCYAAIHTHHAAVTRSEERVGDGGKSDVPAPRAVQSDSVGLDAVGNGAGPAEAHPAGFGYPHLPVAAAQLFDVAWSDCYLPKSFMRAGLAPRRATVGTAKVVAPRLGEVPQRLLLHSLRPGCQPVVFGAGRGQLGTLLVVAGRLATWLPVPMLLDGKVPNKPGMTTVFDQNRCLLNTGKQPKPAHINNLGSATDNPVERRGGVPARPKPRIATPQVQ